MLTSKMADGLVASEIIKIATEVNELKSKGEAICNLTIGDFNPEHFPIPEELREQISIAYKKGFTNYPPQSGVKKLREAVGNFAMLRQGLSYDHEDIVITSGSRPLIYAAFQTLLDQGDRVVYPVPSWNNNHYCHLTGTQEVQIPTAPEQNFMPCAADLAKAVQGASLLALCSPLNPTGTMFTEAALVEICDLILEENRKRKPEEKPLYLLYDQIYNLLTFGGHRPLNPVSLRPEMKPYTVIVDGASKGFASTGVRVGWGFAPPVIAQKMRAVIGHIGAWAPTPEQNAMAAFLANTEQVDTFLHDFRWKVQRSLECLYKGFMALKKEGYPVDAIAPMGAIYLTVKVDIQGKKTDDGQNLDDSMRVNSYLIKQAKMALVPFSAFDDSSTSPWFRASVGGCSFKDIEAVIPRLRKALELLG